MWGRRGNRAAAAGLLAVLPCVAQPPKRPVETLAMVDRARALPPEFSADVMLRLAGSPLVADAKWKRELIEEAFEVAPRAQLPYPQRGGPGTDERESVEASRNGLEALTLEMRAVTAMLPIDPQRARAMFEEVVFPDLPRLECRDVKTPNVDGYFAAAALVFERGFTAKQREKEDDLQFLKQRVGGMRSPADAAPAFRMLVEVKLSPVARREVVGLFAATLDRISGSGRDYAANETELVSTAIPELHDSTMIVPALRSYIVRHVSEERCADAPSVNGLPGSVDQFNKTMARLNAGPAAPITPEEIKPVKEGAKAERHLFWQSARSKQVLEALRWLNHGNRSLPDDQRFWTLAERMTDEWNAHYLDTLKLIEGWREDEEDSPEDYLFMMAHTYATLAALVPPGTARENLMGRYLNFLETRYAGAENRNFWFSLVRQMLRTAQFAKDAKDREWILSRMSRSANPVIALYAQLSRQAALD